MEITRDILKSLIKEELSKVKKPEINESIDVDTLENLENAIKMAYEEMTTPTDVDQTYAGSGEPVSKDPQVMQDKAVEFLGYFIFCWFAFTKTSFSQSISNFFQDDAF